MSDVSERADVLPLERRDPPALGDVEVVGRLAVTDAGIVYAGANSGDDVVLVVLTEGAESDPYARARFAEAVDQLAANEPDRVVERDADSDIAPWVAVTAADWSEGVVAGRALLAPVTMEHVAPAGPVRGPAFRPHWYRRRGVGRWRLWPLPWPASLTAAGRWTYVASFAVMLLVAALALLIAVLVFQGEPPTPPAPGPNPPGPTTPQPSPSPSRPSPPTPTFPTPTQGPGPGPTPGTGAPPIV